MALLDPSTFLGPDSEVPPDVRFQVVDREGVEEGEVVAHRILLSAASPVFKKMFFVVETQDRRAPVIVVRDTSKAAFQALVAAIYSRQPKAADFSTLALADVFELAALAGRYEVLALEGIVMEHLAALPVPAEEEGMMGVAETCLAFAHLEAPSAALLLRCAASLRRATKTVTDSLQFAKRYQGGAREPVAMALLARMAEVPAPPEEGRRCRNARARGVLAQVQAQGDAPGPVLALANAIDHQIHHIDQLMHEIHEHAMDQAVDQAIALAPPPVFLQNPAPAPEIIDVADAPEHNQVDEVDAPEPDLEIIDVNMDPN